MSSSYRALPSENNEGEEQTGRIYVEMKQPGEDAVITIASHQNEEIASKEKTPFGMLRRKKREIQSAISIINDRIRQRRVIYGLMGLTMLGTAIFLLCNHYLRYQPYKSGIDEHRDQLLLPLT